VVIEPRVSPERICPTDPDDRLRRAVDTVVAEFAADPDSDTRTLQRFNEILHAALAWSTP
jgi:predicted secreted protein